MNLLESAPATGLAAASAHHTVSRLPATFSNPLYQGADPWVVKDGDAYFLCQANHLGQITVSRSDSPLVPGHRAVVWTPPRHGWNRAQIWAPELHKIHNRWFIYYAASDGRNENHRMGVLESTSDDPQSPFLDRGALYTGDHLTTPIAATQRVARLPHNRWSIDGTVLHLHDQLYFLWSGWEDHRDVQHLYIAKMSNPWTISSNRIRLTNNNCHPWECVSDSRHERGLHEAPQLMVRNGRVHLVYSCSGSWQPSYKLGLLHMPTSADPMNPASWTKHPLPLMESTQDVFGVGHCSFTTSPDGSEDWVIYHAKTSRRPGWCDRVVRAQPFTWTRDGLPHLGQPIPNDVPLPLPSGSKEHAETLAMAS